MSLPPKKLQTWKHHLKDEADAAFLYDALAAAEPDSKRRDVFQRLAAVERRHVDLWRQMFERHGMEDRFHELTRDL